MPQRALPALLFLATSSLAGAADLPSLESLTIANTSFTLDNGLTVVVHEDHSVPLVAVDIWYHVGSRNEARGRTGFAHLFEHFFFNGSEHYPHGFREAMDDLGANNRNGTTNTDRTNFFEDVPVSALERTLYLEADRMGWLAGHLSDDMLERERGVVQNEKRQGENRPYGKTYERIVEAIYPYAHPYSWTTIGSMADLDAAKLDDIRDWNERFYGPNNAVLVLAGDITVERAKTLSERYFGPIAPGQPVARLARWVPALDHDIRDDMQDRVPQARITRVWHLPPWGDRDTASMELFAAMLAGSNSAPLDRRLVFDSKLATGIEAYVWRKELASNLIIQADVKPGVDPAEVEREIDAVLAEALAKPMPVDALERAQARLFADFTRGIARLGSFGGRADVLAESTSFGGRPDAYLDRLRAWRDATPQGVREIAAQWLERHHYTQVVRPFAALAAAPESIDRNVLPALDAPPAITFPEVQRTTLANGLDVMLMERHSAPLLSMTLAIDAGIAADPADALGTGRLVLSLLDKGSRAHDAFELADRRDRLGATFWTGVTSDLSTVSMQALRTNLDDSLALFAELVRTPAFPGDMLEVERKQQLATIAQEQADPFSIAWRITPRLLYGAGHPYGRPASGSGAPDQVATLDRAALANWHERWFRPNNATLIVAGDVTMAELKPLLQRQFGDWRRGEVPAKPIDAPVDAAAGRIYLIDRPDAPQSVIVAAELTEPGGTDDDLAIETVMRDFGGMATSRLNRNLRLDKHWSYGSSGFIANARGRRGLLVVAPVQSDRTIEAMQEIAGEVTDIAGRRPIAGDEFDSIRRNQMSALAGRFETLDALVGAGLQMLTYGRPPAYYYDYAQQVAALDEADLARAAQRFVDPKRLTWIVIGDLDALAEPIAGLGWGTVVRLDAEGQPR